MNSLLYRFTVLPRPMQAGLVLLTGGGILLAVSRLSPELAIYVFFGLLFVGLLVAGYVAILKRLKKRKSKPFEKDIKKSGGAVPAGVTGAADRARLDEMRKRFEKGIITFRENGKDIYGLPWYVIIGEPGSGKTEAIRHCGIGFPPGLQDELQGSGGTINMDWWFTNHAVILDTAGRLTFDDVESASTREWQEFLRLLRKNRPNCPINGLIIAIPVDSLIQDTADEIERKGGKLARQLDLIQRSLGVRFPVFLVVTKADKLTGFRPFFAELRDPQLQHQMLGWSNPAGLDELFDTSQVDEHLRQITERLLRRRLSRLLEEPSHSDDPAATRTDLVDEMYAFPEALQRIGSRLQRYLEMIFVGGEWSAKPLFLRGIYFTSSMQEGEALDAELAEALNVPVESLREATWHEDRAYFLRDVFTEKIFRERGLVTNATNTRARQRRRKSVVIGAGTAAAVILAAITLWGYIGIRGAVGVRATNWNKIREQYDSISTEDENGVILSAAARADDESALGLKFASDDTPVSADVPEFFTEVEKETNWTITAPWAFRWLTHDPLRSERERAAEKIFAEWVIAPLVRKTASRLSKLTKEQWNAEATRALAHLLDTRAYAEAGERHRRERFEIAPMLAFATPMAISAEEDAQIEADCEVLQHVCDWLWGATDLGQEGLESCVWPPLNLDQTITEAEIEAALQTWQEHWRWALEGKGRELQRLHELEKQLGEFSDAETTLLDESDSADRWREHLEDLLGAESRLAGPLATVYSSPADETPLNEKWSEALDQVREDARREYEILIAAARAHRGTASDQSTEEAAADTLHHVVAQHWNGIKEVLDRPDRDEAERQTHLATLHRLFLASGDAPDGQVPRRLYAIRTQIYRVADELFTHQFEPWTGRFGEIADRLVGREQTGSGSSSSVSGQPGDDSAVSFADLRHTVKARICGGEVAPPGLESLAGQHGGWKPERRETERESDSAESRIARAVALTTEDVVDMAHARRVAEARQRYLSLLGSNDRSGVVSSMSIETAVHDQVEKIPGASEFSLADVPLAGIADLSGQNRYNPVVARQLYRDWKALSPELGRDAKQALVDHTNQYFTYWRSGVIQHVAPIPITDWARFSEALRGTSYGDIMDRGLLSLLDQMSRAMDALRELDGIQWRQGGIPPYTDCLTALEAIRESVTLDPKRSKSYRGILNSWVYLAAERNAISAGEMILQKLSSPMMRAQVEYFPQDRKSGTDVTTGQCLVDFVAAYWEALAMAGLDSLLYEKERVGREAWTALARADRFPLAPPNRGGGQLSREELLSLGKKVWQLGEQTDSAERSTRQFIDIQDPAITAKLRLLDGPAGLGDLGFTPQQERTIKARQALVRALMKDHDSLVAGPTLMVLGKTVESAPEWQKSTSESWTHIQILQGGMLVGPNGEEQYYRGYDRGPVDLSLPGAELRFRLGIKEDGEFVEVPPAALRSRRSNPQRGDLVFDGPWSALQLLYDSSSVPEREDPDQSGTYKTWTFGLEVMKTYSGSGGTGGPRDEVVYWLPLRLVFKNALPDAALQELWNVDWPN